MSQVSSLSISGYKSIRELKKFELHGLNVLIGANGAGKSNFIGLFKLLNKMYEQEFQVYQQVQGGPDALLHFGRGTTAKIHAEFYFANNGYKFGLIPTADNRLIFEHETVWYAGHQFPSSERALGLAHSESKLKEANDTFSYYVRPAVKSWRVYHFHDTSEDAPVKGVHASNDNLSLHSDARNLAAYLRMLRDNHEAEYERIVSTIQLVLPFFDDFIHREGNPEHLQLEWKQKGHPDTPLKAHMLSDGSLRFICLAALLMQPITLLPDTILIDEPELGLHPYAITVLADMFKQVAGEGARKGKQLIVSTQSVELVNELEPGDVIVVDQDAGASTFRRFEEADLRDWLKEFGLGELWKRNILGGRP